MLIIVGTIFALLMIFAHSILISPETTVAYIDMATLLFILVPLLVFLRMSRSCVIFIKYIKTSFIKGYDYTQAELVQIAAASKNTIRFTIGTGVFLVVVCLINILSQVNFLEEGGAIFLALNIAISLLSLLYSLAFAFFVFFPLKAWAENKINTTDWGD